MDYIKQVWDLVDHFTVKSNYVFIRQDDISYLAKTIKEQFKDYEPCWLGYPPNITSDYYTVLYELLAGSVNYQYWYGRHYIRPNGACADVMYKLLDESFAYFGENDRKYVVSRFIYNLSSNRFPNIENRIRHVNEVEQSDDLVKMIVTGEKNKEPINNIIEYLMNTCPGYASDMFLKRVFLFIMMMYRRLKWFEDEIALVPIPADYHIPKMLNFYRCIYYSPKLQDKIDSHELILAGSAMECEIRAHSILACKLLAEKAGCTMCDIDNFLWLNRKKCSSPFHLTVTTDY